MTSPSGTCPVTLQEIPQTAREVCELIAPGPMPPVPHHVATHISRLFDSADSPEQYDAVMEAKRLFRDAEWFAIHPRELTGVLEALIAADKPWELRDNDRNAWRTQHRGGQL
jgi:hypothetical protein